VIRAAVCAAALLLIAPPAFALPDETWVVSVGNNSGDTDEIGLLYAERDAQDAADVLRMQGGVSSRRVRLLLDEDAETVRRSLIDVNTTIRSRLEEGVRSTALIVFYSGHADAASLHLRGTHLAFEEMRALVASSPASIRVLIVDACRSGALTRVKGVEPTEEFEIKLQDRIEAEGMAIIASSAAGESSQESDHLRASFFSHHWLNALRGAADRNGDGQVTLTEAYSYTYAATLRSSGRTMSLQHPTYAYDVKGRGELVLTSVDRASRSGRLRLSRSATYLVAADDEDGPVVAELAPHHDNAVIALPTGRYFVQQRNGSEYREYAVKLTEGQLIDLEGMPYRPLRYDQLVRKRGGSSPYVHGLVVAFGARGEIVQGEGTTPQLVVGYNVDLPWLTAGVRARGTTISGSTGSDLSRRRSEIGLGLSLQRFVDLPFASVSFGLTLEGIYHQQTFDAVNRDAPSRSALGLGFGGILSAERHVLEGLAVRLEAGPTAVLFRRAIIERGAVAGDEVGSALTWQAAGGLVWRL
jgi:hypothetical protein